MKELRRSCMFMVAAAVVAGLGAWCGGTTEPDDDASGWLEVGIAGFSPGRADYVCLDFMDGEPIVAFKDFANGESVTAMAYDGANWIVIGSDGFVPGNVADVRMVVHGATPGNAVPIVAFRDLEVAGKASVMRYTSGAWSFLGDRGLTPNAVSYLALGAGFPGTPGTFVAYRNNTTEGKTSVMEYGTSGWSPLGGATISDGAITAHVTACRGGGDTLFVAYTDNSVGDRVVVQRFDGMAWSVAGQPGISDSTAAGTRMVAWYDTVYVAFIDDAHGGKATVMRFAGGAWTSVGHAGFSESGVGSIDLALSPDGVVHVAFKDLLNNSEATVMRFSEESWETVGSTGFSEGAVDYVDLAVNSDGVIYVAYQDKANGSRVTVMEFRE